MQNIGNRVAGFPASIQIRISPSIQVKLFHCSGVRNPLPDQDYEDVRLKNYQAQPLADYFFNKVSSRLDPIKPATPLPAIFPAFCSIGQSFFVFSHINP